MEFTSPLPFEDHYCFLDIGIHLRTDFSDLFNFLQNSYSRFRTGASQAEHELQIITKSNALPCQVLVQSQNHQYQIFKTTQGFVLNNKNLELGTETAVRVNNGQIDPISYSEILATLDNNRSEDDQEYLFSLVQMALLNTLTYLMPQHHLLHGAALTWHNEGLILAGDSGCGKSSLSLALVKHGCQFLSDDVAGLNLITHQIEPFPRSLNLRQRGLSLLHRLLKTQAITPGPIDIEALFPNSIGNSSPLCHLFLLKGIHQQPNIKPVPKRQAIWQTLRFSHVPVTDPTKTLWQLAPLINRIPCYELIVGELDSTAALICHWLEKSRYDAAHTK